MSVQLGTAESPARSMAEYAADLTKIGKQILPGGRTTFWSRHERLAMMRLPLFDLNPPSGGEVQRMLWRARAAVATYLVEPDARHPANAVLYCCTDPEYSLEKLAPPVRRNVRRGLKELRIAPVTLAELLAHGCPAYRDTRRRSGLSDGTEELFQRRMTELAKLPEVSFLGAWKDSELAGYLTITAVDDWTLLGCFSVDACLQYRPNDTLMYSALSHYLTERGCHMISYGLSSLQTVSNAAGLHRFKLKMGFEARPVHRAFIVHPLLRPFANRLTLTGVGIALRLMPGNRRLKKAEGALALLLGDTRTLDAVAKDATDD